MTDSKDNNEFEKLKANLQEALSLFGEDIANTIQKLTRRGDVPEPFVGISEIYHLRAQVKELIRDQETSDQTINELRSEVKRLQDANDRFTESGVGDVARIKIRNCVGARIGEATHDAVVRQVNKLRSEIKERDRLIEIEREKVEVSLTKNTVLRNTIHELHNRIERLEAEAEVRNCSEPYRSTNIELQQQIERLQEVVKENDRVKRSMQQQLKDMYGHLSGIPQE